MHFLVKRSIFSPMLGPFHLYRETVTDYLIQNCTIPVVLYNTKPPPPPTLSIFFPQFVHLQCHFPSLQVLPCILNISLVLFSKRYSHFLGNNEETQGAELWRGCRCSRHLGWQRVGRVQHCAGVHHLLH